AEIPADVVRPQPVVNDETPDPVTESRPQILLHRHDIVEVDDICPAGQRYRPYTDRSSARRRRGGRRIETVKDQTAETERTAKRDQGPYRPVGCGAQRLVRYDRPERVSDDDPGVLGDLRLHGRAGALADRRLAEVAADLAQRPDEKAFAHPGEIPRPA